MLILKGIAFGLNIALVLYYISRNKSAWSAVAGFNIGWTMVNLWQSVPAHAP